MLDVRSLMTASTRHCFDLRHLDILPTHHFTVHQSAVRVLAWARTPVSSGSGERTADNPTIIASGGYDGLECLTDIREVSGSLLNRTRGGRLVLDFIVMKLTTLS